VSAVAAVPAAAQAPSFSVAGDTSGVPYTYATFIAQVMADHPIARQADLLAEDVRSQLRTAWGAFDPTLSANWDQKRFSGTNYYAYSDISLKIPTPIGSDLKVGFEATRGTYFSTDRRTPDQGLLSIGMSVPLGQRLITDERRTALAQARAVRDAGEADRIAIYNGLLLNASRAYGAWYEQWRRAEIARDGVALARFRLEAVVNRVINGESPPVDTVEASLEVQRRDVAREEAEAAYFAAELSLTAYLWDADGRPVELAPSVRPSLAGLDAAAEAPVDSAMVRSWLATARAANPQLRKVEADVRSASALRLLTAQQLIPFAEAGVYTLAARGESPDFLDTGVREDNYKASLGIKSPLLFLKERGRFGSAGARLDIRRVERDRLGREVENAVRIAANDLDVLRRIVSQQLDNVNRSLLLRDAEQARFDNGESTLLVVNLRERAVLDEATRLAQLEARVAAARAALALAIGDPTRVPGLLTAP
jgi:outer membrane protein TolC